MVVQCAYTVGYTVVRDTHGSETHGDPLKPVEHLRSLYSRDLRSYEAGEAEPEAVLKTGLSVQT